MWSEPKKEVGLKNENQRNSQIFKFLVAGGITVILYYLMMYVFLERFGMWYVLAAAIAFIFNNALNFTLMKLWAFKKDGGDLKKETLQYAGLAIFSTIANCLLLYWFVEGFNLHYLLAQIIATIILTVISFFLTRKIFHRTEVVQKP